MTIKLLATLGPSSLNQETIEQCDQFGIFVFRINLSHTPLEHLRETIETIRRYTKTPICIDSEGAQIRNQDMQEGEVFYEKDRPVRVHFQKVLGDSKNISFTPQGIARQFEVGDIIAIDFHSASFRITASDSEGCDALVLEDGKIGSNKAANLNRAIDLPALTSKDEEAIKIGREMGVKHFALSFASRREDVELCRSKIGTDSYLISKVESRKGVKNLFPIIESTDAILIDRGDLSREIPIEKIPFLQRRIIASARARETAVFVATNLLESMVFGKSPTRAEVNDVVSTVLMGANGLVLAAETAIGQYPAKCAEMIRLLASQCERWTPNTSIDELLM